ncbi:MAG: DUF1848 family protein [Bacteroides sp.]
MRFGITERGDAGIDFSWVDKLLDANIIISKYLNDALIRELIAHKDKIIFHTTCTGYGETILEPNVHNLIWTHQQTLKLIERGFPVEQIVLRVDPIIPTKRGIKTMEMVLNFFMDSGIKRVRYSFLDMYPHVKDRFSQAELPLPYSTFCAPKSMIDCAMSIFDLYCDKYEFESCAENTKHQLGCISRKDFNILGINGSAEPAGFQRKGCLCVAGKTELLSSKVQCPNKCLYCYWKD